MAKTRIVIEAQDKASRAIDQVTAKLQDISKKGAPSVMDLVKSLGAIPAPAALASAAVGGLVSALGGAFNAYKQQYEIEQKLAATIKSTSNGYDILSGKLIRLAGDIQTVTQIDDSELLQGMTRLVELGVSDLPRASQAMADLSVVTGSVGSASEALGLALQRPEEGLKRLIKAGVDFTAQEEEKIKALIKTGKETEAQALILEKVEERYGGISAQIGSLPTKQVERLANAAGDFGESFGLWLTRLPLIYDGIKLLSFVLESIGKAMREAAEFADYERLFIEAKNQLYESGEISKTILQELANASPQLLEKVYEKERMLFMNLRQEINGLREMIDSTLLEYSAETIAQLPAEAARNVEYLQKRLAVLEPQMAKAEGRIQTIKDQIDAYKKEAEIQMRQAEEMMRLEERRRQAAEYLNRETESLERKYLRLSEIHEIENDLLLIAKLKAESLNEERKARLDIIESAARSRRSELNYSKLSQEIQQYARSLEEAADQEAEFWRLYSQATPDERLFVLDEIGKRYGYIKEQIEEAAKAQEQWGQVANDYAQNYGQYLKGALQLGNEVVNLVSALGQARIEEEQAALDNIKGNLSDELRLRKEQGEEVAQYEINRVNEIKDAEESLAKTKADEMRKVAILRKAMGIADATITGTEAVLKALATPPVPNVLLATLTGALTAAKIATIAATPIPALAEGGIVRATPGGRLVLVGEGGKDEAVVPLDRGRGLREVHVHIGTLIGAPTRETIEAIRQGLKQLDYEAAG